MATLLDVIQLRKEYASSFALGPLDFSIREGEILALLGPNGSGKTTCLKMVAGLLRGEAGSCRFTDAELTPYRRHIGYMSEEVSIWPDLRCGEQIELLQSLYGCGSQTADELKQLMGLTKYSNLTGATLSLGNKRKLSLILSAVHDPELLILDEPFNGLDALGRRLASRWLRERVHSASAIGPQAVLISSHQLEEIESCADRVLIIKDGQFVDEYFPGQGREGLASVYHELFAGESEW